MVLEVCATNWVLEIHDASLGFSKDPRRQSVQGPTKIVKMQPTPP